MAVTVKEGETYEAKGVRTGDGWTMFKVKAEKGSKELAVFVERSEAFREGDTVRVTKITAVKLSARKGKDDKWYDTMSVNAEVEASGGGLRELDDDGELPF